MSDEIKIAENGPDGESKLHFRHTWLVLRFYSSILVAVVITFSLVLLMVLGIYTLLKAEVSHDYISVVSVIAGITGLLTGVRVLSWLNERVRRDTIKKIRDIDRKFFERVETDITSRISEKVN